MPKALKRKAPVTLSSTAQAGASSNPHASRTLIRRFHTLLKTRTRLRMRSSDPEAAQQLAEIEKEINELGGLEAYQRMSTIGQGKDRGGGTEKVLIGWLKEMSMARTGRYRYVPSHFLSRHCFMHVCTQDSSKSAP